MCSQVCIAECTLASSAKPHGCAHSLASFPGNTACHSKHAAGAKAPRACMRRIRLGSRHRDMPTMTLALFGGRDGQQRPRLDGGRERVLVDAAPLDPAFQLLVSHLLAHDLTLRLLQQPRGRLLGAQARVGKLLLHLRHSARPRYGGAAETCLHCSGMMQAPHMRACMRGSATPAMNTAPCNTRHRRRQDDALSRLSQRTPSRWACGPSPRAPPSRSSPRPAGAARAAVSPPLGKQVCSVGVYLASEGAVTLLGQAGARVRATARAARRRTALWSGPSPYSAKTCFRTASTTFFTSGGASSRSFSDSTLCRSRPRQRRAPPAVAQPSSASAPTARAGAVAALDRRARPCALAARCGASPQTASLCRNGVAGS